MSRIEKLAIRGIRSFDPQEEVKIEFFRPLTLIQGHNGSGKTTIIECLKMASCGSLPPLATNGKTFICDPKINGATETKGSVKLKFLTPRDKEVLIIRNFQLSIKSNKYEFKRLEQLLKSYNSSGELVTINSTCIDIDKQVPLLMHSSKAILENVIFCHQEETNWPFTEAGNLKKVFDEIFDTAKYTKALEEMKDLNKSYISKSKELKTKIELMQKDFDQYKKLNIQIETNNAKVSDINSAIDELSVNLEKADKDYKQIQDYEEQFRQKENEINMTRMRMEEKVKQINNIKSDPFFQDFTEDEEQYQMFLTNYQNYLAQQTSENVSEGQKVDNIRHHLERFTSDFRQINEEINNIDATIISKNQIFSNLYNNKREIVDMLNRVDSIELKFEYTDNYDIIVFSLVEREEVVKEKLAIMEEKMKSFSVKLSEKLSDGEVTRALIESKKREIDGLTAKKAELMTMMKGVGTHASSVNEVNEKILQLQISMNEVNNSGEIEKQIQVEESNKKRVQEKLDKLTYCKNKEILTLHITRMNEYLEKYENLESGLKDKIVKFNQNFSTNYSINPANFLASLDEMSNYIRRKKEEIIEEKQNIREQNCTIATQIEMSEKALEKIKSEIKLMVTSQDDLFSNLKFLFDALSISMETELTPSKMTPEAAINNVSKDVKKIRIFRDELEAVLETLNQEKSTKQMEIKFMEEYIFSLQEESECAFCTKPASLSEVAGITKDLRRKMADLETMVNDTKQKIEEKCNLVEEIKKADDILKQLETLIEDTRKTIAKQKEVETELQTYYDKRKFFENNSKEKTNMIFQLETFLGNSTNSSEEIYKLKNGLLDLRANISKLCDNLGIKNFLTNNIPNPSIILSQLNERINSIAEYTNLETELKKVSNKIQELFSSRSARLERLHRMNMELRILEGEKVKLSKFTDINEYNNKISEIDGEIVVKTKEKELLELESSKLGEMKNLLLSKKAEFEAIYNEKNGKYRTLLERIHHFKVKIECAMNDLEKVAAISLSSSELSNQNIEDIFNNQINQLKAEKTTKESRRTLIEKEIQKLNEEIGQKESEKKKVAMKEILYKNNVLVYSLKQEVREANDFLVKNESKITINSKISSAKEKINEKLNVLKSQYNLNLGKLQELENYLGKLRTEVKNDHYYDIENRFIKLKVEYILAIETSKQIENYSEALDNSLLKYHAKRMEEINKLINYYWSMTYKGNDIKWIEIRSDVEKAARSRSYNYRIVYGTTDDCELDMRGRCSAGQKVLASIIIRLALAETFCNNCGILCLDEPTTNLDDHHVKSLARALREIIQSRSEDQNFQLIVITHDPTFVDLIGSDFCDSFWYVSKNNRKFSKVDLKPINSIFNN